MHIVTFKFIVGLFFCSEPNLLGFIASIIMDCWKHTCTLSSFFFDNMETKWAIVKDRETHKTIHKKELDQIITLLEQLALVSKKGESGLIVNAYEFINYELEYDLNIPPKEEIVGMLNGGGDVTNNEPIEEVDNVQIGNVGGNRVGFKDVESALVALKLFFGMKTYRYHTFHPKHLDTLKRNRILACTTISLNHCIFVLPLCLNVR